MKTEPVRIQRKRTKGWRLPPNTVCVTRPSKWGNPYRVGRDGTADQCIGAYRKRINENVWTFPSKRDVQSQLRGKNLACFCPLDRPCHADILLEIANA